MVCMRVDSQLKQLSGELFWALGQQKLLIQSKPEGLISQPRNRYNQEPRVAGLNATRKVNSQDRYAEDYQIDQAGSTFTLLHTALYKYVNRLICYFWKSKLIVPRSDKQARTNWTTSHMSQTLKLMTNRLYLLKNFIREYKFVISKGEIPKTQQKSMFKKTSVERVDCREAKSVAVSQKIQAFIDLVSYQIDKEGLKLVSEELSDEENASRQAFYTLLDRTLEIVELLSVLDRSKDQLGHLPGSILVQISRLSVADAVLSPFSEEIVRELLLRLSVQADEVTWYWLTNELASRCPSYFKKQDMEFVSLFQK